MKRLLLSCSMLLFFLFSLHAQRDPSNEILVYFKEGVKRERKIENGVESFKQSIKSDKLKSKLKSIGVDEDLLETALPNFNESDTIKTLPNGEQIKMLNMAKLCRVKVKNGQSKDDLIEKLKALPEVLYAEPNGLVAHFAIPSDTRFNEQWGLRNTVTLGEDIHAVAAWDIFTGNPNNIIGIIDGGTNSSHLDLNDKISGGDSGFGWGGHGIHVSGIAAAESNNSQGVSGVDWNAKIHAQRIDNVSDDAGTYQAIVDAVNYSSNLHVLNHSWGLISGYDELGRPLVGRNSITVRQAFAYAYKANRTSVVAMGNHQAYQANVVGYPAGFDNIITVGATTSSGAIANYSAQGGHIDVSAPGSGILSTYNSSYGSLSGTSMATPHVSGIASLLKGYNPNLSNNDIENIIKLGSDDTNVTSNPGFDNIFGHGRVNAEKALNYLRSPYVLNQETATGGAVYSTSSNYTQQFLAAHPSLASGNYVVKRKEIRKTVTFPTPVCQLVGVWGRGYGSSGWSAANPNYGEGFIEIVPGTASNTGATLRTYVYEVYTILGQFVGHYPTSPENVAFKYSVLGIPGTGASISGSNLICTTGSQFTLDNPPSGLPITWSVTPSNLFSASSGSGSTATLTASSTSSQGSATLTYSIANGCGSLPITVNKAIWVGKPQMQLNSIIGSCYEPTRIYSASIIPNASYNWTLSNTQISGYGDGGRYEMTGGEDGESYPFTLSLTTTEGTCTTSNSLIGTFYKPTLCDCGYDEPSCGGSSGPPSPLNVFPNPASEELNISLSFNDSNGNSPSSETIFNVTLINNSQTVVYSVNTADRNFIIPTNSLPEGRYYLQVTYQGKVETRQILIDR